MGLTLDPDFATNQRIHTGQGGYRADGTHDVRVMAYTRSLATRDATFVGVLRNGVRPYVKTFGHRKVRGLAEWADGTLWSIEQGTATDDEADLIEHGGDHGPAPAPRPRAAPSWRGLSGASSTERSRSPASRVSR